MSSVSKFPKRPVQKTSRVKLVLKIIGVIYLASIVLQLALHDWAGHPKRVAEAKAAQVALAAAKANSPECVRAKDRLEAAILGQNDTEAQHAEREAAREVVSNLGLQAGKDTSSQYWDRVGAAAEVNKRRAEMEKVCR